jgi:hypothetical protein
MSYLTENEKQMVPVELIPLFNVIEFKIDKQPYRTSHKYKYGVHNYKIYTTILVEDGAVHLIDKRSYARGLSEIIQFVHDSLNSESQIHIDEMSYSYNDIFGLTKGINEES